jgi:hypothetical protein
LQVFYKFFKNLHGRGPFEALYPIYAYRGPHTIP